MPATVNHQLSATTPDDPLFEIRPSHWNQSHALTLNASGSEISGAFSNANGISFGLSNGAITASYTVPAAGGGGLSNINVSAGTTSNNLSAFTLADANGVIFGLDAGTITASHNGLTTQSGQAFSAAGGSSTFQTLAFRNTNGISFSNSNGSIEVSYTVPTVPAQLSGGLSNIGNTAGDTGLVTGRLVLAGGNNITLSGATNGGSMTVTISGAAAGGAQTGISGIQVSDTTYTSGTVTFRNLNGISFGSSGANGISASYTVPTVTNSSWTASDSATSLTISRLAFSAANGMTLAMSTAAGAATVTGSYTVPTVPAQDSQGLSNIGNTSGNTGVVTGRLVFAGGNNITLSGSTDAGSMTITVSGANIGGAQTGISGIQVSDATYTSGTVTFRNANGVSFGSSGANGISASYTVPTVTNSSMTVSDSATSGTLARLAFTNLNGVTLSLSTGAGGSHTIVGSHNGLTSQSNQAFSADAMSNFQTLVFQNSNGVSFSNNAGSLRVTHDLQFTSATSAITSNALHSSASRVFNIIAATNNTGGGTASLSSNVSFSNANGLTFYTSAGNAVVGSYTVPTVPAQFTGGFSTNGNTAGDTGLVTGRMVLAGGANITLSGSTNAGSITVSIVGGAGGAGDGGNFIAAGTRTAHSLSTVLFSNANGITFGLDQVAGSIVTASYTVPTQTNQTLGIYGSSQTVGQSSSSTYDARSLSFVGRGAVSVGWSNSSLLVSAPDTIAQTVQTQSNIAGVYDGANSISTGTIRFTNANGVSFSINGQTISGSVLAQTVESQSIGMSTQTAGGGTGGTTGYASGGQVRYHFVPGSNITMSQSINGASGTLSIYAPAPGAAAENNWMHALGANTSGNTTASGSTIGLSGINLTISGTNNSVFNLSVPATSSLSATGIISLSTNGSTISIGAADKTLSGWRPYVGEEIVLAAQSNASLLLEPLIVDANFQYDRMVMPLHYSQATNSTLTVTNSIWWGWFSRNGSSLSLYKSGSGSFSINGSGTASSANNSGIRVVSLASTDTVTVGNYVLGLVWRTTTAGANASLSNLVVSAISSTMSGYIGLATNTRMGFYVGRGVWTSTTAGMPSSVAISGHSR